MRQWRDIHGYEGIYQVSDLGQVRSLRRNKLLSLVLNQKGYVQVNLYRYGRVEHFFIHRLVISAFLSVIPSGHQINHIDGVKTNNCLSNLEIVTPRENRRHAEALGLMRSAKGEGNMRAKLTEEKVKGIRRLRADKVAVKEIASQFGVSKRLVYMICKRDIWGHVP